MRRQVAAAFHEVILLGLPLFFLYTRAACKKGDKGRYWRCGDINFKYLLISILSTSPFTSATEGILKFEWNEQDLTPEERMEIQEFLDRVNDLGLENAFFDEEALVFIDGTHVPIPEKVKVIRD
jgi:hypothetical protein